MGAGRRRWVEAYYLGTPLFALADLVFGANVRAVGLAGHPELRAGYYAACLACGVASFARPAWAGFVGLAESSLNLLVLALSVFLPYYALVERVLDGGTPAGNPLTPGFLANFVLSSAVWLALWYGRSGVLAGPGRLRT